MYCGGIFILAMRGESKSYISNISWLNRRLVTHHKGEARALLFVILLFYSLRANDQCNNTTSTVIQKKSGE
jgi:hypothetical protein